MRIVETIKPSEEKLQRYMREKSVTRAEALEDLVVPHGKEPTHEDLARLMTEYDASEDEARDIFYTESDMRDGNVRELTPDGDLVFRDDEDA